MFLDVSLCNLNQNIKVVYYVRYSDSELLLFVSPEFEFIDEITQGQVYHSFYSLTYNMVLYIVKDYSIVQDVIQEAFLQALKKRPINQDSRQCKAWIIVVTRNIALNYIRKLKRFHRENNLESSFIKDVYVSVDDSVENQVENKLLKDHIRETLYFMKPDYRLLIELRWQRQLSYQEISDELDLSPQVVQQKLFRARKALRKQIRDWL